MFKNQKRKILILIKGLGLGGAERLIIDSLPYLDHTQFDYHFAYMLTWKNFLVPWIEAARYPVHCLGMAANYHFPLLLPRLAALQAQHHFDLIHADMPQAGILARLVGRAQGLPVVYTEHNLQERFHPVSRRLNGWTYSWNRRVLAVSDEVAASIRRNGLDRQVAVKTLLNGVPVEQVRREAHDLDRLRAELAIPAHHRVVGAVAVFRRQKRLEDWLAVAARVAAARDDVTFLLVGDGPEAAKVKAEAEAKGLTGRLVLPGFREDGRRLMGLMDVYLLTSGFEGLPIALLEAMALGKAVVATAVGGIPELVEPGHDGLLAPVGAIETLAGQTLRLLAEPALAEQLGRQAATKIERRFHIKHRVREIERLYLEVLAEARQPAPVAEG
ncbi:MAG: glycosyltransferase [Anaerolineae bacterium]|nr:glycosyltransferase [Anaerolineae bacterium]